MINLIAVDDEQDVKVLYQHFFSKEIESNTIQLFFESSGSDCLNLLPKLEGDIVVLTDINMPNMTGIELLEKIENKFPNVKVILVSAYDKSHYEGELSKFDVVDYISKPVNFIKLKSIVLGAFS